jgi:anti-anti-sigma factor
LNVTVESARDVVTVRCWGRLVRGQETALLCAVFQQNGRDVILDLSRVTAIDTTGIGALVSLQAAGIYVRLVSPSFAVYRVLRLIGLDSIFEISEPECSKELAGCSASLVSPVDSAEFHSVQELQES